MDKMAQDYRGEEVEEDAFGDTSSTPMPEPDCRGEEMEDEFGSSGRGRPLWLRSLFLS
jgi:hypothetical protein